MTSLSLLNENQKTSKLYISRAGWAYPSTAAKKEVLLCSKKPFQVRLGGSVCGRRLSHFDFDLKVAAFVHSPICHLPRKNLNLSTQLAF